MNNNNNNKLGDFIKQKREANNLSLRDLAEISGLSHNYISLLEKGYDPRSNKPIVPTIESLIKLSNALNVALYDFLIETGYVDSADKINKEYNDESFKEFYELAKTLGLRELIAAKEMIQRGLSLVEINKALKGTLQKD